LAKAKRGQRKVDGWKSKQWYNIVTPDMMGQQEIGETFSNEPGPLDCETCGLDTELISVFGHNIQICSDH